MTLAGRISAATAALSTRRRTSIGSPNEGLRFTNAYAACPVCSPSRAAIMTGKYPARLHLTDWLPGRSDRPSQNAPETPIRQELPLEEITLAEALKPVGYATASLGKWHLGGQPFYPEHQGFDLNVGGTETGSPPGGYFHFHTPNLKARTDQEYLTDRLTEEAVAVHSSDTGTSPSSSISHTMPSTSRSRQNPRSKRSIGRSPRGNPRRIIRSTPP